MGGGLHLGNWDLILLPDLQIPVRSSQVMNTFTSNRFSRMSRDIVIVHPM